MVWVVRIILVEGKGLFILRRRAYANMVIADALAPNRRQVINNHHAYSVMITSSVNHFMQ